jgi:16S rRNA (cytosine1402-N4)-methyltransferase
MTTQHIPVLLTQVCDLLRPQQGDTVADLTAGLGGHAEALAEAIGPSGTLILMDLDADNLARAETRIGTQGPKLHAVHGNFAVAASEITQLGLRCNCVLADLGFASPQMDDPNRGFSFQEDGPLDMRLDRSSGLTATDLLNSLPEAELAKVIRDFGEEPLAGRIAQKIALARQRKPIQSTSCLVSLVREAYGARARSSRNHPATRTFMALRIAVNDELAALDSLLEDIESGARQVSAGGWLEPEARIAIISFHSLEDRRVKRVFIELGRSDAATLLTRKPLRPTEEETAVNPRARSGKLRAIELASPAPSYVGADEA